MSSSEEHTPAQHHSLIGVGIVEDSAMLRELLAEAINEAPGLQLVGSAGSLREALSTIDWPAVSLASIDLQLPDGVGLDLARDLRTQYPDLHVAILSDHRRPTLLDSIPDTERRFWSYILKSSITGRRQLGELLAFSAAHPYIDVNVAEASGDAELQIASLSEQQRQILALVARGLSNSAISRSLALAEKSIEYHLRQIYLRLGIAGDSDANQRVTATVLYLRRYSD